MSAKTEIEDLRSEISDLEIKLGEAVAEIRKCHGEKALAPGLECHCEFCDPERKT